MPQTNGPAVRCYGIEQRSEKALRYHPLCVSQAPVAPASINLWEEIREAVREHVRVAAKVL